MKNVTEFANLPAVSVRSLSQLLELDRDIVRSAIERAGLSPISKRGGYPAFDFRESVKALFARKGIALDPEMLSPADRRAVAQSRLLEHQLLVKSGEYLPREAYRSATAEAYARCASTIKGMPDHFERRLGLSPEQTELAEDVVTLTLQTLFDDMRRAHEASTATA